MAEKGSKQLPAPTSASTQIEKKESTFIEKVEQELQEITKDNFYVIPGAKGKPDRLEPDARALQYYANKKGGISTRVVDSGMTMERAWAKVQAWLSGNSNHIIEDSMTMIFEMEFQSYVWDYVRKGCERHKGGCPIARDQHNRPLLENGVPVLADPGDILNLRGLLNRKMRFSERECITKVKNRLYKQLLSMEWREQEETQFEAEDVGRVNEKSSIPIGTQEQQAGAQSTQAKLAEPKQTSQPKPAEKKDQPKPSEPKPSAVEPEIVEKQGVHQATGDPVTWKEKNGVPMANIPTDPLTPPVETKPSKKRSERIADLCNLLEVSNNNIIAFIYSALGISDVAELKNKEDLGAVVTGLEGVYKKFGKVPVAKFMKKEPMETAKHEEIEKVFLSIFASEMNKNKAGGQ